MKNQSTIETETRGGSCDPVTGSAAVEREKRVWWAVARLAPARQHQLVPAAGITFSTNIIWHLSPTNIYINPAYLNAN